MVDRDVLDGLHAEGVRTLERQMALGEDLDTKASQLLRFNALVIGLTVSLVAIALQGEAATTAVPVWTLGIFLVGVGAVVASTLFALLAYEVTTYVLGMRADELREVLRVELSSRAFLERLVLTYASALEGNRGSLDVTASRLKVALWLLLLGIAFLGLSAGGFMYGAI